MIPSANNPVNAYSEIGQDQFVIDTFKNKRDGTFLEVGGHDYIISSNTYRLEKELNWSGIGVEIDNNFKSGWDNNRPNSTFIHANAITLDYGQLLKTYNMPPVIDYLSVDIDPPQNTLAALIQILNTATDFKFNVITFETDYYKDQSTRDVSRSILKNANYMLIKAGVCSWLGEQDDFYIHANMLL